MQNMLSHIRSNRPVIHCITNYVTANDCANLLLACGASPVMADAPEEAAEMTARSKALLINLGTLSRDRLSAMVAAGICANDNGIPVVMDPVGVGASTFRRKAAATLMKLIRFTVIRGNPAEIGFLAYGHSSSGAVDAAATDPDETLKAAKQLALQRNAVVMASGAEDIITDGQVGYRIRSGHPIMRQVTGAGCMLSALTAAFLTVYSDAESCAAAACAMGYAGICAAQRMQQQDGNASFRNYLIDAFYHLDDDALKEQYEKLFISI